MLIHQTKQQQQQHNLLLFHSFIVSIATMSRIYALLLVIVCAFLANVKAEGQKVMPDIFDPFNLAAQYTMNGTAYNTILVDGFPVISMPGGVIQDPLNKRGWYNLGPGGITVMLENITYFYFPAENNACYALPLGYDAQVEAYEKVTFEGAYVALGRGSQFVYSYAGQAYDISVCGVLANIRMDIDPNGEEVVKYGFYQPFPSDNLPPFPGVEYPPIVLTSLIILADQHTTNLPSNIEDYFVLPANCNNATLWCDRADPGSKRSVEKVHPKLKAWENLPIGKK